MFFNLGGKKDQPQAGPSGQRPSLNAPRLSVGNLGPAPQLLLPGGSGGPAQGEDTRLSVVGPENFLAKVPLLKDLSGDELKRIAGAMEEKNYPAGSVIFRQGDKGDSFYVIVSGEADVLVRDQVFLKVGDRVRCVKDLHFGGKRVSRGSTAVIDKHDPSREFPYTIRVDSTGQRGRVVVDEVEPLDRIPNADKYVATLRYKDYFGEMAIISEAPRAATVVARTALRCLTITHDKFKHYELHGKLQFAKRRAVMATYDDAEDKSTRDTTKSDAERQMIQRAIVTNQNISNVVPIHDDHLHALSDAAYKKTFRAGELIIKQGDTNAREFYIIASGEVAFHVDKANKASSERDALVESSRVGTAGAGASFGELALLYHAPRAATVTASQNTTLFVIDRATFKTTLMKANDRLMAEYMGILGEVETLKCLLSDERAALAEALVKVEHIKGDEILKQGDSGDTFYILYEGAVSVTKDGKLLGEMKSKRSGGDTYPLFGERALLENSKREATVTCSSDECVVLALPRDAFTTILGPLSEILKESTTMGERRKTKIQEAKTGQAQALRDIKLTDLKRLGLLGCGGFGAVTLEQHKETGETFALKQLSKGFIVKMRMQKSVIREKEILSLCDSWFIIKLSATMKTQEHLYFLLEPALGGELFATYHKHRFHGSVSKARFYSASVTYAFDHLHSKSVLFRDLKPENLLLDSQGFCKLTDMGLAKVVTGKTYTTCGTPDYFAPEVIQQTGMTRAVDWWTLGILIHELISGHAPFEASDPMETYQKIIRGAGKASFPYKDRDPEAMDLVLNLLKHNPIERLPMKPGGVENIKKHSWYRGFKWTDLESRNMTPPYVPQVKSTTDASNFRAHEGDMPPQIPYKDTGSNWDATF